CERLPMALDLALAFKTSPPPVDYVLPNMVAGTVGAIVSPGGTGKSMLALQLAIQLAGGPDLLEIGPIPTASVLYLPAEDPPTALPHPPPRIGRFPTIEQPPVVASNPLIEPLIRRSPGIMAPNWFDGLGRAASGRRLMILDTF